VTAVLKISDSEKCPTKWPDMSDESEMSDKTANYVRRNLTFAAYTENNREPGVHCNKKRHQIMPFIFTGP